MMHLSNGGMDKNTKKKIVDMWLKRIIKKECFDNYVSVYNRFIMVVIRTGKDKV